MDQSYNEQYAGSEPDPAVDLILTWMTRTLTTKTAT